MLLYTFSRNLKTAKVAQITYARSRARLQCTRKSSWIFGRPEAIKHTLRSVNDVTEGSTQEAHMCAS